MRLRTVIPTLEGSPSNKDDLSRLLNAFDELQLLTPEDVVLRSSEQDLLEKLPHDIIDRRHISTLFQEIVDLVAAAPKRGDEVYAQEQELVTELNKYIHCINTGVPSIDALIRFPSLGIVELSGLPATGKTVHLHPVI